MALKVSIIIPVFNEASTVRELLNRVWAQELPGFTKELVIVESNSTDGSRKIVADFTEEKKRDPSPCKLIFQDRPLGKGFAMREGLAAATGDIILIQDADLEYDVNDYPALLQPIADGRTAFVLGSRHLDVGWKIRHFEKSPWKSLVLNLGGWFFHGFFNLLYGQRLTDPTTMYKVFRRECLTGLQFSANRFDFDFELLGKLIRSGFHPLEVPVSYSSRGFDQGKKVRVFRDPMTWVIAIIRYRFSALRSSAGSPGTIRSTPSIESSIER